MTINIAFVAIDSFSKRKNHCFYLLRKGCSGIFLDRYPLLFCYVKNIMDRGYYGWKKCQSENQAKYQQNI